METQIKGYADSVYKQSLMESAVTARAETTNLLKRRATKKSAKTPLKGIDPQAIINCHVQHIERCMAARLESYRRAYEEAREVPTEEELNDILHDFQAAGELQVKHSSSFIDNFFKTSSGRVPFDATSSLIEGSAKGHDRVLRSWETWRDKAGLRRTAPNAVKAPVKAVLHDEVATQEKEPKIRIQQAAAATVKVPVKAAVPAVAERSPVEAEVTTQEKRTGQQTMLSYYWNFLKRLGDECNRTWRGELVAAALVAAGSYLLIRRVDAVAWTSFKTAGLSTAIALGCIALWHVLRTPWLLHKDALKGGSKGHKVHWASGFFGIAVLAGTLGGGAWYATKHFAKPTAQAVAAAYREPKDSLRRRTVALANDLGVFLAERWAKRPPGHGDDTMKYDQATYNLYMKLYKARTVGILQELQDKGLDTGLLAAPGGAQSRFLMPDEIRQLRDLAYHLDEKGNVVRF